MKLAITLIALLVASTASADGVAYRYTNDNGVVSFTDDAARVPAKFEAEEVDLGDDSRVTPIENVPPAAPKIIRIEAAELSDDCGPIRVRTERRQRKDGVGGEGTFSTRFYIAEDDCRVLFDAPYYPDLNALRS